MKKIFILFILLLTFEEIMLAQNYSATIDSIRTIVGNGEYKTAIKLYTNLIETDTLNYELYFERGSCYAIQKNNRLALNDLNKSIELNPNFAKSYYNRSIIRKQIGNYDASKKDKNTAIELEKEASQKKSTLSVGNFEFKKIIEVIGLKVDSIKTIVDAELIKTFKDPKSLLKEHNVTNGIDYSFYEAIVNTWVSKIGFSIHYELKIWIKSSKVKFTVENFQAYKNGDDDFSNKVNIGNLSDLNPSTESITINKWNAIKQDVSNQVNGMLEIWEKSLSTTDNDGF